MSTTLATIRAYDIALWIHVTAVITAFGALFAYPVFLAVNARAPIGERASFHRLQIAFSKRVTGPVIGVVLLAGVFMASDDHLWSKVWVTVPFVLLFVIAGLGSTVMRRGEEALLTASERADDAAYATAFATVRIWTAVTVALLVITVFFMTAKPFA